MRRIDRANSPRTSSCACVYTQTGIGITPSVPRSILHFSLSLLLARALGQIASAARRVDAIYTYRWAHKRIAGEGLYSSRTIALSLPLPRRWKRSRESSARSPALLARLHGGGLVRARFISAAFAASFFLYRLPRRPLRVVNERERAPPFLRGSYIFLYESITRKVRAVQCAQVIRRILLVNARGEIEDRSWRWVWGRAPPPSLGGTCTGRCNRPRAEFFSLFSREVTSFERRVVVGGGIVVQGKLAVAFWKGDEVWWREREREIVNLIVWKFYFISWEASIFRLLILILSKNV